MKITRVESWPVSVRQETPYAVAYGEFDQSTLVFLQIETDAGIIGYGSAGCDSQVSGETAASVQSFLKDTAEPYLRGQNPLTYATVLQELKHHGDAAPSALATVDMALFDIVGKHIGLPLWKILGACRDRIQTCITIGILPLNDTLASAKKWIDQGFSSLKLKGGIDVDSDIQRVIRVRELVDPKIEICFDANQGYTVEQALRFANETREAHVVFLEQPTTSKQPELLGQVRKTSPIPIMADECAKNAIDVYSLAKREWIDLVNVKLMKSGGILEALQIEAIARAAGVNIMVGCMDESALGIAAGLQFALASPAVKYADLDGHIGLIGDPVKIGLRLENGFLYPPDKPGLGIEPTKL
jgi:L-alanine-DL-glutamate epimerase-like enolase superfamily enzyme